MSALFFLLSCGVWVLDELWIFLRELGKLSKGHDEGTRARVAAGIVFGLSVAVFASILPFYTSPFNFDVMQQAGGVLILCGVFIRFWSVVTLGKYFRTVIMIQKGHRVIKSGPYALIRHPSYTGVLLSSAGFAMGVGSVIGVVLAIGIIFWSLRKRMDVEERELSQKLGKEYKEYMKKTKRLLPFIY